MLLAHNITFSIIPSTLWHTKTSFTMVFLAFPAFVQFLWPFFGVRLRWWWRVVQGVSIFYAVVNVLAPTLWFAQKYLVVWEVLVVLPQMIGMLALIGVKAWRNEPEARVLAVGVGALFTTVISNILVERNVIQAPEFTNYAMAGSSRPWRCHCRTASRACGTSWTARTPSSCAWTR